MCGAENRLYKAEIEGTILNVCQRCARFGKVLANIHDNKFIEKIQKKREEIRTAPISENEITETLAEGFNEIIKKKREELALTQEEFAKKLNEKESIIHKIETGSFAPNIPLARKIEKFLRIKIVEQTQVSKEGIDKPTKSEAFTLGDFIKVRK